MTSRLFIVLFALSAAPALARHDNGPPPKSCAEKCESGQDECVKVCTQYGGAKGAQMCRKGCGEGVKRCQDKCKGKKR